jgi:cysteinyl-tRNA synthetase
MNKIRITTEIIDGKSYEVRREIIEDTEDTRVIDVDKALMDLLLKIRYEARIHRNFTISDMINSYLYPMGYRVVDGANGADIRITNGTN